MIKTSTRHLLLMSAAAISLIAGAAHAQTAAAQSAAAAARADDVLGEVVVTATRQVDTVSKVALSITATTQKQLDQQGISNVTDLARTVPALSFRRTGSDGTTNIAIRGIYATAGAPTTGVYIDDTPLQKRFSAGAVPGNGNPYPELFDLERVEVLRGPQGTLYGGSSEGGTVRFITPAPSLNKFSVYLKGEANTVNLGAPGGGMGVAVGGPIVQDKLGFRGSIQANHVGGYIDHVDIFSGATTIKDSNSEDHWAGRFALTWAPTSNLKITPAYYGSRVTINDIDNQWGNVPSYTTPTRFYNAVGQAATAATAAYTLPGYTYPANNNFGRGKVGQAMTSPRTNTLNLGSLTIDYDLGAINVKSITSYIDDAVDGRFEQSAGEETSLYGYWGGYLNVAPSADGVFAFYNNRHGVMQEVRLQSNPSSSPLSWVAGVYYSDLRTHAYSGITETLNLLTTKLRGVSSTVYYGVAPLPGFAGAPGELVSFREQFLKENEIAGFGEANYKLTDKLKITAGVRVSQDINEYNVSYGGQLAGYNTPTVANGGITSGKITETPVTPKVGLSYQMTDKDLLYFTAARGYRPGGVNSTVPALYCAAGLAALGQQPPATYNSDTVMSYEGGAKLRLFGNRAQINSSVFYIDWSNIQVNTAVPGCPYSYVANVGKAVSQGFDIQSNARLGAGFSTNLSVGFTDARYTQTTQGPPRPGGATPAVLVYKGDQLPVAPWNASVGLQYDTQFAGKNAYARMDFQFASSYHRTVGPGATGYTPDTYLAPETHIANLRVGTTFNDWDLSVYANNLFDSTDKILESTGRSSCTTAACTAYSTISYLDVYNTFRPRTVGVTAIYRY